VGERVCEWVCECVCVSVRGVGCFMFYVLCSMFNVLTFISGMLSSGNCSTSHVPLNIVKCPSSAFGMSPWKSTVSPGSKNSSRNCCNAP
jgi:hypothetical protein